MNKEYLLVVEDSKMFLKVLSERIAKDTPFSILPAGSLQEAQEILQRYPASEIFCALLDLNLPDAGRGEVVDLVISHGVPAIIFTGDFEESLREDILNKGVIDYVLKESASSIDYVVELVMRLYRNQKIKVLVADDSTSARNVISKLLKRYMFHVVEASDGQEALNTLDNNPDIKLLIVDYNMPVMDGFQLTKKVRSKFDKSSKAIIGVSSYGNNLLSAKFIKNGANDFINKPFLNEEFFCRISQNLDTIEYVQALKNAAIRDFLTGLHNRRYLFDVGRQLHSSARRGQITLTIAILDLDFFKKVNDTYGHDAGDEVLKSISRLLAGFFRETDVVARTGGEEFVVLCVDLAADKVAELFDSLRQRIQQEEVVWKEGSLHITASIGVTVMLEETLDETMAQADRMLYCAKEGGRNQVVCRTKEQPNGNGRCPLDQE
ncbi:MAG: diguanylate cyclase [Magnetococcales bacterium]|nr:diguanylate cyclase [Magnetococcales bacterium]NGZ27487.1 diguanylate cyclase [Magnetococcales bacterium]